MRMPNLVVCDLDGTLIGDAVSLRELLDLLERPGAPILAFATGRQGYSATELLARWGVRKGAYLIAGVGTEIYRRLGKRWMAVAGWPELRSPWDASRIKRELAAISTLVPQNLPAASAYKLSYVAPPESVAAVATRLRAAHIDATIVHSHGELLDVLPVGVDKGSAAAWLARHLALPFVRMMTFGNTTNDTAMLQLPCPSVIVGDADPALLDAAPAMPNTFVATAPCAGGIIEGLRHFGWLRGSDWVV